MIEPAPGDRRFKDEEWAKSAVFDFIKQSYLLTARSIHQAVGGAEGLDPRTAARVDFYTRQFLDAMAPTNSVALNPSVLKATLESGGENLIKGLANLLEDVERGKGELRIRMTDLNGFDGGRDRRRHARQGDLQERPDGAPPVRADDAPPCTGGRSSSCRRGSTSSTSSTSRPRGRSSAGRWRRGSRCSPSRGSTRTSGSREGLRGLPRRGAAGGARRHRGGHRRARGRRRRLLPGGHAALATALAYLAAKGDQRITAATLLHHHDRLLPSRGSSSVFIDEEQLQLLEQQMSEKGYLDGAQMASAFSMIRANDSHLVVRRATTTCSARSRCPSTSSTGAPTPPACRRRMHSYYLRNMYQHNRLREPGGLTLARPAHRPAAR